MNGPVGQHRAQLEGQIGRGPGLLHGGGQYHRRTLTAELRRGPQLLPAAGDELLIGLAKAARRAHARLAPVRAFLIATAIDGIENAFGEPRRFAQDGLGQLG